MTWLINLHRNLCGCINTTKKTPVLAEAFIMALSSSFLFQANSWKPSSNPPFCSSSLDFLEWQRGFFPSVLIYKWQHLKLITVAVACTKMKNCRQENKTCVFQKHHCQGLREICSWNKYSTHLTSSITAGGAGSCQTEEAWLAIESLNAAPFPPQTHGIYINLQLLLAGGNFFFLF